MTRPPLMSEAKAAIPPAFQLLAGNTAEHTYGKIALTIGAIQTVARSIQETLAKHPTLTPALKIPTQGREFKGKSRAQKISESLMVLQWSVSTMIARQMTNPRAVVMPHVVN